jgi:hypothetical protein
LAFITRQKSTFNQAIQVHSLSDHAISHGSSKKYPFYFFAMK